MIGWFLTSMRFHFYFLARSAEGCGGDGKHVRIRHSLCDE